MSSPERSRVNRDQLPEARLDDPPTAIIECANLSGTDEEIQETQQAALILLAVSKEKGDHRKRKAEVELNDGEAPKTKKRAGMDVTFVSGGAEIDPGDMSTHSPERNAEATTTETPETEVQALRERIKKDWEIIRDLFKAINILGNRLTRAEGLIHNHFGAIASLRADLNRTDGRMLALVVGTDRLNILLIQLLSILMAP